MAIFNSYVKLPEANFDASRGPQVVFQNPPASFLAARGGGIPRANHVFDARHIKNPQKGPQKHLTGLVRQSPLCWIELSWPDVTTAGELSHFAMERSTMLLMGKSTINDHFPLLC